MARQESDSFTVREGEGSPAEDRPNRVGEERLHGTARLSTTPLAVLLPVLGDIAKLPAARANIERRLRAIQSGEEEIGGESGVESKSEESMLNQVLQWLTLRESKE